MANVGAKSDYFVGKTIFEVLDADTIVRYEPLYRQALRGEPFNDEHQIGERCFLTKCVPLRDENGEIYAALAVSYDITERRRTEKVLLDADQRKDEFLAMLVHELRNPLTPIRNGL